MKNRISKEKLMLLLPLALPLKSNAQFGTVGSGFSISAMMEERPQSMNRHIQESVQPSIGNTLGLVFSPYLIIGRSHSIHRTFVGGNIILTDFNKRREEGESRVPAISGFAYSLALGQGIEVRSIGTFGVQGSIGRFHQNCIECNKFTASLFANLRIAYISEDDCMVMGRIEVGHSHSSMNSSRNLFVKVGVVLHRGRTR